MGSSAKSSPSRTSVPNVASFSHNVTSTQKFSNILTSVGTPVAPGGFIAYYCDGTSWLLIGHEQGSPISFTTTWAGTVSNPSLGNGALTTQYYVIGTLVYFTIRLIAGSTTTFGSCSWTFTVPIALGNGNPAGSADFQDSSAGVEYAGNAHFNVATSIYCVEASAKVVLSSTQPFTWAVNDQLATTIWYQGS